MKKITRTLVHRLHRDNQLIEVVDQGDLRSLYFAGNVLQSSQSRYEPHSLALSYTRHMMAPLVINDEPRRVLVIGVGAGSLIRFLHHHFPDCSIDGVDRSRVVLDLARDYFQLPENDRVAIHCCDGSDYLRFRTSAYGYDLILIDAFDAAGMAAAIYHADFFALCYQHLALTGILSLNLWSGDPDRMNGVAADIGRHFPSLLQIPVPNRGNVICLAGSGDLLTALLQRRGPDLAPLQARFGINFRAIVRICRRHNLGLFERMFG